MTLLIRKTISTRVNSCRLCTWTVSTANACWLLRKYFRICGCEAEDSYISKSMLFMLEVYTRQLLNDDPDIYDSEKIQKKARWYLQRKEFQKSTYGKTDGKYHGDFTLRRSFWATFASCYYNMFTTWICLIMGTICRALHEVKIGDLTECVRSKIATILSVRHSLYL